MQFGTFPELSNVLSSPASGCKPGSKGSMCRHRGDKYVRPQRVLFNDAASRRNRPIECHSACSLQTRLTLQNDPKVCSRGYDVRLQNRHGLSRGLLEAPGPWRYNELSTPTEATKNPA